MAVPYVALLSRYKLSSLEKSADESVELNLYLLSNATIYTAIYYLDVCAIPDQHRGVWDRIKRTIAVACLPEGGY